MREYFHAKKVSFVRNMKYIFLVLAFIVPLVLLVMSLGAESLLSADILAS